MFLSGKKILVISAAMTFIASSLLNTGAFAKESSPFAGGAGTPEDPWQIESAEQLSAVNEDLAAHYVLTSDIDLSSIDNFPMLGSYVMDENSAEGEDPIAEMAFTGTFDGAGHTISNLSIDCSQDMEHMFGVGLFSCVGKGGVVKDLTLRDIDVKGMMLVGGAVGYAFHCTINNVDLTAAERNHIESTMVMAGGVIGGLTCSTCSGCDVENTDIQAAPGGNSGILGGGFSKPVLENCTVKNSTITAALGEVPTFGMTEGAWIGALTGCVNLDDFNPAEWYVKNCVISDAQVIVSGKGLCVGGLIGACGVVLSDPSSQRMLIQGCKVENTKITVSDGIPCVGGLIGAGFSEGEEDLHSFQIDGCSLSGVDITTDAESLQESATALLVGKCRLSQFTDDEGSPVDITDTSITPEQINCTVDATLLQSDGNPWNDSSLVGQVIEVE